MFELFYILKNPTFSTFIYTQQMCKNKYKFEKMHPFQCQIHFKLFCQNKLNIVGFLQLITSTRCQTDDLFQVLL